ncbi:MAG: S9 family peptidase [Phycisphaerae bacterium]|nr:S9 family peptidase [Phycisphaerae bacterium]
MNLRMTLTSSGFALWASVIGAITPAHASQPPSKIAYPKAEPYFVDYYHGTAVADPYRWLEDSDSAQTRRWIDAQNAITFPYLEAIPQRTQIQARLKELWNYERYSAPGRQGGKYFYSYNTGLQNQSVMLVTDALADKGRVIIDPNTLKADGTAALAGTAISEDARYVAYGIADAGSDWNVWKVREVATGADLPDEIRWVKFSGASWMKDGSGFFYSRYDEPKQGQALTAVNYYPKMYFHKVNTPQAQDSLVYERPDQKEWGLGGGVTEDGRFIVMSLSQGTDPKNRLYVRDLKSHPLGAKPTDADTKIRIAESQIQKLTAAIDAGADKDKTEDAIKALRAERAALVAAQGNTSFGFVELLNDFDASYEFVGNDGTSLYISTNLNAPRGKLIAIELTKPARENWKVLIPEAAETLQGVGMVGDYFFASYLKDAKTQVKQFDLAGKLVREVQLPGIGTAGGFAGKRDESETFYSFTSYNVPGVVYRYDVKSGQSTVWKQPSVKFNPDDFTVDQKFYASKDGTKVPMFIVHKKSVKLDGSNPTLLYGYGGFNIPLTPAFSPGTIAWLEMGGVYAVANIRGGGEYGEDWHKAGTGVKKQNVFDDFIAAAEFLIAQKYTSKGKIACQGGSNGGLLVGAMVTQRPDLWGACLPAVGVLDMLRFQKFTIGWAWKSDYGDTEGDKDLFEAVRKYSPYHVALAAKSPRWPATLITTGDHDDRVVPAHSFKFAAALQATQAGDQPVLIRIDVRAGHGAGKPTAKRIEELADTWAFLAKNLGMGS